MLIARIVFLAKPKESALEQKTEKKDNILPTILISIQASQKMADHKPIAMQQERIVRNVSSSFHNTREQKSQNVLLVNDYLVGKHTWNALGVSLNMGKAHGGKKTIKPRFFMILIMM